MSISGISASTTKPAAFVALLDADDAGHHEPSACKINASDRAVLPYQVVPSGRVTSPDHVAFAESAPVGQAAPTKRIVIIPPAPQPRARKLRVAAYCRTSTALVTQATSLAAQRTHFLDVIQANPNWELTEVYWEHGVSATGTRDRPEFQRLINDCRDGRIDLVLTKSISRFSRNTLDCLRMVRMLASFGVSVRFEKERLQTNRMESELLFATLSAFAQDESRSISQNVRWGIQRRFENGTYLPARTPFGYRRLNGTFLVHPDEAAVVRQVFDKIIAGSTPDAIARELTMGGIPTWTQVNARGELVRLKQASPSIEQSATERVGIGCQAMTRQTHVPLGDVLSMNGKSPPYILVGSALRTSKSALHVPGDERPPKGAHLAPVDREFARTDCEPASPDPSALPWRAATIRSIVANPFYTGDCVYQKTFVDEAFRKHPNTGARAHIVHPDHHPAIIDRATFAQANAMLRTRAEKRLAKRGVPPGTHDERIRSMKAEIIEIAAPNGTHGDADLTNSGPRRKRVAAYCRVSTASDEQETSYAAQCAHYTRRIAENPEWELAGIFADEGITGTQAKRRPEFMRLVAECEAGRIDLVITKSISRFARNTIDCLTYIRKLKALGIPIIFEKESINTMDASGEILITILASIAQQESASISANVRMGIEYGFQEGRGRLKYSTFLGYTGDGSPGSMVIVPEEADLVRRIYRDYLDGFSPGLIARRLMAEGVPAPGGGSTWYATTIAHMLANEKYCGDLLMQKYVTIDFLTHKVVRNTGQRPQYFVSDNHDPIVPKDVFAMVQAERRRRSELRTEAGKLRFGSRDALVGRLVCGKCGRTLKRYRKPDPTLTDWRCRRRAMTKRSNLRETTPPLCDLRILPECEAKRILLRAFNELPRFRDEVACDAGGGGDDGCNGGDCNGGAGGGDDVCSGCGGCNGSDRGGCSSVAAYDDEGSERDANSGRPRPHEAMARRNLIVLIDQMEGLPDAIGGVSRPASRVAKPASPGARGAVARPALPGARGAVARSASPVARSPACRDAEDFFARTNYRVPDGILDASGRMAVFSDDVIVRYLRDVIVYDDVCEVRFRAGLVCRVPRDG